MFKFFKKKPVQTAPEPTVDPMRPDFSDYSGWSFRIHPAENGSIVEIKKFPTPTKTIGFSKESQVHHYYVFPKDTDVSSEVKEILDKLNK